MQPAIKGSKSGDWSVAEDGTVTAGGLALQEGEYTLETVAGSADDAAAIGVLPRGGFVVLDTAVTPELAAEGLARDLVRAVQQARRDAGLDVSDRIALTVAGSDAVQAAARTHEALITGETLATSYDVVAGRRLRIVRRDRPRSTVGDGEQATVASTRSALTRRKLTDGSADDAGGEAVEVGEDLVLGLVGDAPDQLGGAGLGPGQRGRRGSGRKAISTRMSGSPSRPASAQAL